MSILEFYYIRKTFQMRLLLIIKFKKVFLFTKHQTAIQLFHFKQKPCLYHTFILYKLVCQDKLLKFTIQHIVNYMLAFLDVLVKPPPN